MIIQGQALNQTQLDELRQLQLRNRIDRYKMIQENVSKVPFMPNIGKSQFFKPSHGVTHRDFADHQNSPKVSGGVYKHPNQTRISKKEFLLRQSLSALKEFGPAEERKVNQSLDVHAFRDPGDSLIGFSVSPSNFSTLNKPPERNHRINLPVLKSKGRAFDSKELLLTKDEIRAYNSSNQEIGPSPGAWDLANSRHKLKPMLKQVFSFNRVNLRNQLSQSIHHPPTFDQQQVFNESFFQSTVTQSLDAPTF